MTLKFNKWAQTLRLGTITRAKEPKSHQSVKQIKTDGRQRPSWVYKFIANFKNNKHFKAPVWLIKLANKG